MEWKTKKKWQTAGKIKGEAGKTPVPGVDFPLPKDGVAGPVGPKGESGIAGSPDTPPEIRDKLQSLQGAERLDASAIKNLPIAYDRKRGAFTTTPYPLVSAPYVTISADSTLTNERVLTGTTNQISVTDNGAGSTVVIGLTGAAANGITALTGDVTATGPGSVAATLATVNGNVGSFGSATQSPQLTVNGKGLITAVSNVTITPASSSLTGRNDLAGTANQVILSASGTNALVGGNNITLSLPQSIATTSSVTFGNVTDSALTAGRVTFAGTAGILTDSAALTFNTSTSTLALNSGQLSMTGVYNLNASGSIITITPTVTQTADASCIITDYLPFVTPKVGFSATGMAFSSFFYEGGSGTHPFIRALDLTLIISTNGGGAITDATALNINAFSVVGGNVTNASQIKIAAPTGGTNNHAIWVTGGKTRLDGDLGDTTNRVPNIYGTALNVTSVTDSGLTSGRVTFATTGGLLTDDADFTFATDTLTVTKLAGTNLTGNLLINNATKLQVKDSGGATRDFMVLDASNNWILGSSAYSFKVATDLYMNSDGGGDVGGASNRWRDGRFSRDLYTVGLKTASGALTVTPAAGSNLDVALSTTGDFVVNTNQLYVDTSTTFVGLGIATPATKLEVYSAATSGQTDVATLTQTNTNGGNAGPVLAFEGSADSHSTKWTLGRIKAISPGVGFSSDILFEVHASATQNQTTYEAMRIQGSTGNVGIGMTPARTLDVTGTFGATGAATLGSTLAVTTSISTPSIITASGNLTVAPASNGTLAITPTGSGLVSINTSFTSNAEYSINSPDTTWGTLKMLNVGSATAPAAGIQFVLGGSGTAFGGMVAVKTAAADARVSIITSTDGGTTNVESLTVIHDGNVGIGTTSPQSKLHLNHVGTNAGIRFQNNNGAGSTANYVVQTDSSGLGVDGFGIYDVANTAYRLVIDGTGDVGIGGVTAPVAKLEIQRSRGNILTFSETGKTPKSAISNWIDTTDGAFLYLGANSYLSDSVAFTQFDTSEGSVAVVLDGISAVNNISFNYAAAGAGAETSIMKLDEASDITIAAPPAAGIGATYMCLSTGNVINSGATCAASLRIYKENEEPYLSGLSTLMKLEPKIFDYKHNGQNAIGFIADDVEEIDKRLVVYTRNKRAENIRDKGKDKEDIEDIEINELSDIDVRSLLAVTIKSIQEQQSVIEILQSRLETLMP